MAFIVMRLDNATKGVSVWELSLGEDLGVREMSSGLKRSGQ